MIRRGYRAINRATDAENQSLWPQELPTTHRREKKASNQKRDREEKTGQTDKQVNTPNQPKSK